jgi:hypothetical protein
MKKEKMKYEKQLLEGNLSSLTNAVEVGSVDIFLNGTGVTK